MGPSGCGKSTLLNLIGLLDRPTSGVVHIDGQLIETYQDKELAKLRNHKIGFVFQEYHLISFDHHDRTTLRPASARVMPALSYWALPRGQAAELNRDEYSRPAFNERADAWVKLVGANIVSAEEVRIAERITGDAPTAALTGAETL
jgi:ABC-type cobalamin/Fe3+-siderophores transport system ATPase subunit